jgi:hypothetical protein
VPPFFGEAAPGQWLLEQMFELQGSGLATLLVEPYLLVIRFEKCTTTELMLVSFLLCFVS